MAESEKTKVWDPLVRTFHWLLVAAFFTAYFTEGEPQWLHTWAGYLIVVLLVVRVIWGFAGSRHARFSDFVRSPGTVVRYIRDRLAGRARYYLGHNPAGGVMVLALMISLLATTGAGMTLLAAHEGEGPLAGWLIAAPAESAGHSHEADEAYEGREGYEGHEGGEEAGVGESGEEVESAFVESVEEVHEFFANLTLILVIVHVLGVVAESLAERQNLARSMITGQKRTQP